MNNLKSHDNDKLVRLYEGARRDKESERVLIAVVETDKGFACRIMPIGSSAWREERLLQSVKDTVDHATSLSCAYFLRPVW